jgi:hypothetical protein
VRFSPGLGFIHHYTSLYNLIQLYAALHNRIQPYTALYSIIQQYTALYAIIQHYRWCWRGEAPIEPLLQGFPFKDFPVREILEVPLLPCGERLVSLGPTRQKTQGEERGGEGKGERRAEKRYDCCSEKCLKYRFERKGISELDQTPRVPLVKLRKSVPRVQPRKIKPYFSKLPHTHRTYE